MNLVEEKVEDSHLIFDALKEVDLNKSLLLLSRKNSLNISSKDVEEEGEEEEGKMTTKRKTRHRKLGVVEKPKRQRKLGISERDEMERYLVCQIIKMATINEILFEINNT